MSEYQKPKRKTVTGAGLLSARVAELRELISYEEAAVAEIRKDWEARNLDIKELRFELSGLEIDYMRLTGSRP